MHSVEQKDFKPDYTPLQMVKMGVFGGTYFRRIYCTLNKRWYENVHQQFPWAKPYEPMLTGSIYNSKINYYGVKVGTSLEFWQEKNWIRAQDPYGWFQWYCRYHEGRRTDDDLRQIKRWLAVKKRFQRPGKVYSQIRLHWAIAS